MFQLHSQFGSVVKYRFVKGQATDGSDVKFVGEFAVSGDLYTNGTSQSTK